MLIVFFKVIGFLALLGVIEEVGTKVANAIKELRCLRYLQKKR